MKDIYFELLLKEGNRIVYEVYLRGVKIGKTSFLKKENTVVISRDFDDEKFSGLTGVFLMNEMLISALYDFEDCKESKIFFKDDQIIDYYDDVFSINKKHENKMVCYFLKR